MDCSDLFDSQGVVLLQIGVSGASVRYGHPNQIITVDVVRQIIETNWGREAANRINLILYRLGTNDVKSFYPNHTDNLIHEDSVMINEVAHYCTRFGNELATEFNCHAYWLGAGQGKEVALIHSDEINRSLPCDFISDHSKRASETDFSLGCLNATCRDLSKTSYGVSGQVRSPTSSSGSFSLLCPRETSKVVNTGTGHFVSRAYRCDMASISNALNAFLLKIKPGFNPTFIKTPGDAERWGDKNQIVPVGRTVKMSAFDVNKTVKGICWMGQWPAGTPLTSFPNCGKPNEKIFSIQNGFPFATQVAFSDRDGIECHGVIVDPTHSTLCVILDTDECLRAVRHKSIYSISHLVCSNQPAVERRLAFLRKKADEIFDNVREGNSAEDNASVDDQGSQGENEGSPAVAPLEPMQQN
jgi:hypothetical protein